jgi:hypothetical protein
MFPHPGADTPSATTVLLLMVIAFAITALAKLIAD